MKFKDTFLTEENLFSKVKNQTDYSDKAYRLNGSTVHIHINKDGYDVYDHKDLKNPRHIRRADTLSMARKYAIDAIK